MEEDVILPLQVSIEELYNGTLKRLSFSRNVICSKFKGKGSKSSAPMACDGCQGSGMKASICNLGLSMTQQMQHLCNECKGTGETVSDRDWCLHCKGEKAVREKKVFEVVVEKGMQNGQKITFPGEAVETPETAAGDIVFVLQQKEHAEFKRNGHDLFVEHTVSLTEALCGFQFLLTHLDNRQLLIKSNPDEVLMPDQFMAINGEGVPMYQRPFMRGKLYLQFTVDFPRSLTSDQCKALGTILPPRTSVQLKDMMLGECEETTLVLRRSGRNRLSSHGRPTMKTRICIVVPRGHSVPSIERAHQPLKASQTSSIEIYLLVYANMVLFWRTAPYVSGKEWQFPLIHLGRPPFLTDGLPYLIGGLLQSFA